MNAETMLLLVAALVVGGLMIGAVVSLRRRADRQSASAETQAGTLPDRAAQLRKIRASDRFWGVGVESHCRASSRLVGHRFLFDQVPVLPIEGCEASECRCCYLGLVEQRRRCDRRSGSDRRASLRMDSEDRRTGRPRRSGESNSWVRYGHL